MTTYWISSERLYRLTEDLGAQRWNGVGWEPVLTLPEDAGQIDPDDAASTWPLAFV